MITSALGACPDQRLLDNPVHPGEWGPWPTGSQLLEGTFTKRDFAVQMMYPAEIGSEVGKDLCKFDLRLHMPPTQAVKIPDEASPMPDYEHCWDGLPFDTTHGPYPVIVFIHGTAGFRTQSAQLMTHWASRGFVVFAADYPGIWLYDMLNLVNGVPPPNVDQAGDTKLLIAELQSLSDPRLAFLRGRIDIEKLAIIGHSAGAGALSSIQDLAQVLIPMAGGRGVTQDKTLKNFVILAGLNDSVSGWTGAETGYERSPAPKRLAIVELLGHHFCSDLCWIGEEDGGLVAIAVKYGIWIAQFFAFLADDGCHFANPAFAKPEVGWAFTRYATSATLEETLQCNTLMPGQARNISNALGTVYMYKEEL